MRTALAPWLSCSALIPLWFLAGCATKHTASSAQNYAPSGYRINQLVVVAFTDDDSIRRRFEDGYAQRMTELGVKTGVSYGSMPRIEDLGDNQKLQAAKAKTSADTSVLVEVIEENKEARGAQDAMFGVWVAGLLTGNRTLRSAGAWGGAAATGAAGKYKLRVTLWKMANDSLLWTVDTDSYVYDLASTKKSGAKLAEAIHSALRRDGLIR